MNDAISHFVVKESRKSFTRQSVRDVALSEVGVCARFIFVLAVFKCLIVRLIMVKH